MASNVNKWISAGFDSVQWSKVSSAGYITGSAGLTASNTGTSSSMARLEGAQSGDFQRNTPTIVNIPGDDISKGQFLFEATDRPTFQLTVGVQDTAFLAAIGGYTVVSEGGWEFVLKDSVDTTPTTIALLFTRQNKSLESGSVGSAGFQHLCLPSCQASYLGSGFNTQGEAAFNFQIIVNDVDTFIDGRTVSSVTSAAQTRTDSFEWTSNYRVSASVLVGDGVETDVTLANQPVSPLDTTVTRGSLETTGFASNAITAISATAPFTATGTGTAASGKFLIVLYEFTAWGS